MLPALSTKANSRGLCNTHGTKPCSVDGCGQDDAGSAVNVVHQRTRPPTVQSHGQSEQFFFHIQYKVYDLYDSTTFSKVHDMLFSMLLAIVSAGGGPAATLPSGLKAEVYGNSVMRGTPRCTVIVSNGFNLSMASICKNSISSDGQSVDVVAGNRTVCTVPSTLIRVRVFWSFCCELNLRAELL